MIKVNSELVKNIYDIYKKYYNLVVDDKMNDKNFVAFMEESKAAEEKIYNALKTQTSKFKITSDLPYSIHKLVMMANMSYEDCCKIYKLIGIKVV